MRQKHQRVHDLGMAILRALQALHGNFDDFTMSEYQYYEFAAIDGPVTEADAPYVYSVSSRAEITPRRWRNVYNFGDFRGSPIRMMEHYDAHVYVTNWGTFQFMIGFPENLLPPALRRRLAVRWLRRTGRHRVRRRRQRPGPGASPMRGPDAAGLVK